MRKRLHDLVVVLRAAAMAFSADGSQFLASAIAFSALFAAIPLSLVIITMFAYIWGTTEGSMRALHVIQQFTPDLYLLIYNSMPSVVQYRGISGLVGLGTLIWAAKGIFGAVAYALDRALGVPSRHFVWEIVIAVVLVPIAGLVLLATTLVPIGLSFIIRVTPLNQIPYGSEIASYAASLLIVFVLALLIYAYLPNRRPSLRFGVPGATITAIGFSLAQVTFAIYTTHTNFAQFYGTLSAIFAFMLWIYLLCMIFLYGAHVSAQIEHRWRGAHGAHPIPEPRTLAS